MGQGPAVQSKVAARGQLGTTRAEEQKADPRTGRQKPLCKQLSLTHARPQLPGPSAGIWHHHWSPDRGREERTLGRVERQVQLTSDRKVCADFWAPMCNRYSYTYSANLQAGGSGSGSQEARGWSASNPALGVPGGTLRPGTCLQLGRWRPGQGAHIEPSLHPPSASH